MSQLLKIHHPLGMGTRGKKLPGGIFCSSAERNHWGCCQQGCGGKVSPTPPQRSFSCWCLNLRAGGHHMGWINKQSCGHSTCSSSGSLAPFLTGSRHPFLSFGPWGTYSQIRGKCCFPVVKFHEFQAALRLPQPLQSGVSPWQPWETSPCFHSFWAPTLAVTNRALISLIQAAQICSPIGVGMNIFHREIQSNIVSALAWGSGSVLLMWIKQITKLNCLFDQVLVSQDWYFPVKLLVKPVPLRENRYILTKYDFSLF